MIFDLRETTVTKVAEAAQRIAREGGMAHVYVTGYVVTILREYRPLYTHIGSFDGDAALSHIRDNIQSESADTIRKRPRA